jgi:hypothetical protein
MLRAAVLEIAAGGSLIIARRLPLAEPSALTTHVDGAQAAHSKPARHPTNMGDLGLAPAISEGRAIAGLGRDKDLRYYQMCVFLRLEVPVCSDQSFYWEWFSLQRAKRRQGRMQLQLPR